MTGVEIFGNVVRVFVGSIRELIRVVLRILGIPLIALIRIYQWGISPLA